MAMNEVDRVIHEPARLAIMALLSGAEEVDFLFLMRETELTKGNLSSHLAKLEEAGYVEIEKTFRGKIPLTLIRITKTGRKALDGYRETMNGLLRKL
jgi:DNA-binding transcriptional ArsR family regulator